jgi:hypothetical protein
MGPPGAVLYLDGGVALTNPNLITFAGYTVAQFTGDLGGIAGANTKCRAEFPGATFCTASDVHQSEPDTGAPAAGAWVDYDRDSLGNRATSPCNNGNGQWSYGAGTADTSTFLTTTGATSSSYCNVTRPISCCNRTPRRIFRGFTSLSFTGDLGGFVGANAKCRAEFPGSYFCASADYALAETTAVPGVVGAWIDYDRDSAGQRASSPCNNGVGSWTYGAGTADTSTYLLSNGTISSSYCNVSRPIACCQTP